MKFRDDVYKNYRSTGKGWKKKVCENHLEYILHLLIIKVKIYNAMNIFLFIPALLGTIVFIDFIPESKQTSTDIFFTS